MDQFRLRIVHVVKAEVIVTSAHLKLSTLFAIRNTVFEC